MILLTGETLMGPGWSVIRGLAIGTITEQNTRTYLLRELRAGCLLALILGVSGWVRAALFGIPIPGM